MDERTAHTLGFSDAITRYCAVGDTPEIAAIRSGDTGAPRDYHPGSIPDDAWPAYDAGFREALEQIEHYESYSDFPDDLPGDYPGDRDDYDHLTRVKCAHYSGE